LVIFFSILGSFGSAILVKSDFKYWFTGGGIVLLLVFLNNYLCKWELLMGMKIVKLHILILTLYFYIIGDIFVEEPYSIEKYLEENDAVKGLNFVFYRGFMLAYFL
jgi:hypothetical protein